MAKKAKLLKAAKICMMVLIVDAESGVAADCREI